MTDNVRNRKSSVHADQCCGSTDHHCQAGHHHVVPTLAVDCDERARVLWGAA